MVPDYYARLEIEPDTDREGIEAALRRKQPLWSLGTRNPKTRHTSQSYLDEIPALRKTLLSDATARQAYDAELSSAKKAERQRKIDELSRRVRLRAARGVLDGTDRKLLTEEAERLGLGAEAIAPLTKGIPVADAVSLDLDPSGADGAFETETLEPATRRQIRVALDLIQRRDLYDALGVSRDAPNAEVEDRADEERRRWMNKAQVTAEKTAWLEIISHAQSHLGSAKARARYDRTLQLDTDEAFEALIEFAVKRRKGLDEGTRKSLINEAAAMGIDADRAEEVISRKCRRLDIAPSRPAAAGPAPSRPGDSAIIRSIDGDLSPSNPVAAPTGPASTIRCRECSGLTPVDPAAGTNGVAVPPCRHCGAPLEWQCPVCRKSYRVDRPRCDCGFRIENREPLIRHFAAAQHAFTTNDLELALESLRKVQEYAPTHVGARNGIAKVRERLAELGQAKLAYERAKAGGNLVAALGTVDAWRKLAKPDAPDVQEAWTETAEALKRAEALTAQARKQERTDPPAARRLYREALAIAADLSEASAGLKRTPPDPPTRLIVDILGDRIKLRWTSPAPDELGPASFVILRKQGGGLEHSGDGVRLAEVSEPEFEDKDPPAGERLGYAVLSRRNGVDSITAVTLGTAVFLPDVTELQAKATDAGTELSWSTPPSASDVRVIRKAGSAPENAKDGERIASSADRAVDRPEDGQPYYYGVYAIYRMDDGRLYASPGVVIAAPTS